MAVRHWLLCNRHPKGRLNPPVIIINNPSVLRHHQNTLSLLICEGEPVQVTLLAQLQVASIQSVSR